jgi:peptidoglycan DL-endopeptidase CwlO
VKRVERSRSHLSGGTPAQRFPRCAPRARRVSALALGAIATLLVTAAAWPPASHVTVLDSASPVVRAWLLSRSAPFTMPPPEGQAPAASAVAPVRHLRPVDLVAVSAKPLPARALAAVRRLHGVRAAQAVDAARVQVNGEYVAVLGVVPSQFREFAAKPTAEDTAFWRNVAAGGLGLSYTMGQQDKLPAGSLAKVAGRRLESLRVGRLGTVGIGGVDAVVSDAVARSLGFPVKNAIVISAAPQANFATLAKRVKAKLPHAAAVDQMAFQVRTPSTGTLTTVTTAGSGEAPAGLVTSRVVRAMLSAALSRVGMPYVWGAAGPRAFDCSGLVQWSFAQAGVVMPRVAAEQALTGPAVPVSRLEPGDLLFYHTDPTAPGYISHVAIYLGDGKMIQAPETGMDVEVVPVVIGSEFAGAVDVSPRVAAEVAGSTVG